MVFNVTLPPNLATSPVKLHHPTGGIYVTLQYKHDYIEVKWNGHILAENVVCAAMAYLDMLRQKSCHKLLNDKSDACGDWQEANEWLQFEWLPEAKKLGLLRLAHVYSSNMFSRLAARELQQRVAPELSMKNFHERELAERWLQQPDEEHPTYLRAVSA